VGSAFLGHRVSLKNLVSTISLVCRSVPLQYVALEERFDLKIGVVRLVACVQDALYLERGPVSLFTLPLVKSSHWWSKFLTVCLGRGILTGCG
jgi:hypothetical protein